MTGTPERAGKDAGLEQVVILGGGFTGLAAGYVLSAAGRPTLVLEAGPVVGGLSRTERFGDFLFDLGGHRFHTRDREVEEFVTRLMGDELIRVERSSKIYLRGRFFDYPLRPGNAVAGLGLATATKILFDYVRERARRLVRDVPCVSLEDWVVENFGRSLFDLYFKEYSEKVWGLPCHRISEKWVSRRIRGLSLSTAVRNAFVKFNGREVPTLADSFSYPREGIGRIAEQLRDHVDEENEVRLSSEVREIRRDGDVVTGITIEKNGVVEEIGGGRFISTIPVTAAVKMMSPSPPERVLAAAERLRFRDLLLVAVAVDRERVTDETWVYIPEKAIPFGRIHEPKNWSPGMAPQDRTLLVVEYFCTAGEALWNTDNGDLERMTVEGLGHLGFVEKEDVSACRVLRVPKAYPLFEVGFERDVEELRQWLSGLENFHPAGRSGVFEYYNMDHAIRSGLDAAAEVLNRGGGS